jgi:type 1 glutamine amidotransferase
MRKLLMLHLYIFLFSLSATCQTDSENKTERKIVLIAGKKSHGPGLHEYLKTVRLLKVMLENSPNVKGIKAEVHYNGWPEDPSTLNDADEILFYADGSDFKEEDDPLFVGDHLKVIEQQMKRGCGLFLLHYSTFAPNKYGPQFLNWVGGYFDYQSGPLDTFGRHWYSNLSVLNTKVKLASPHHAISNGLKSFEFHDEYYYQIHFPKKKKKFTPIWNINVPGLSSEQTVAWAIKRKDGGRGFAYTGGHFYNNWENPNFRRMILNAIVWTSGKKVPKNGVQSEYYSDEAVDKMLDKK